MRRLCSLVDASEALANRWKIWCPARHLDCRSLSRHDEQQVEALESTCGAVSGALAAQRGKQGQLEWSWHCSGHLFSWWLSRAAIGGSELVLPANVRRANHVYSPYKPLLGSRVS